MEIEIIPSELLAKIAGYLTYKDAGSFLRTNRTIQRKLHIHSSSLPKSRLTTISIIHVEGSIKMSVSRNSFNCPKKEWLCKLTATVQTAKRQRCDSSENLALYEFYNKNGLSGMKWDAANKYIEFAVDSIVDSLGEHAHFIFSKAHIMCLKLMNLEDEEVAIVAKKIQSCRSTIGHLQIVSNRSLTGCYIDFISATKADTIDLRLEKGCLLIDAFFQCPTVQKMWSITLTTGERQVNVTDNNIKRLTADTIEITGTTNVTVSGIFDVITEWSQARRKISRIEMGLADVSVDDWRIKLSAFNPEPVNDRDTVIRLRRSDKDMLNVFWSADHIKIYVDEEDDEGEDYEDDDQDSN